MAECWHRHAVDASIMVLFILYREFFAADCRMVMHNAIVDNLRAVLSQEGALRSRSARKGAKKDRRKRQKRRLAAAAGAHAASAPLP